MKRIKWVFLSSEHNYGTDEAPDIKQTFIDKDFLYSDSAFEAAQREAYEGKYEIYDDGQPEPEVELTPEERIAELEEALALLLSGVTE